MNTILFTLLLVLVSLVLYFIFRIFRILDILRGSRDEISTSSSNSFHALFFVIFIIGGLSWLLWYGFTHKDLYILPVASQHGVSIERMFWLTMGLILVVLVLTHLVIGYALYSYRHRHGKRAVFHVEDDRMELIWTVGLSLALSILVYNGWRTWTKVTAPAPSDAEVVELVGYQFAWSARYGGLDNRLGGSDYRLVDVDNRTGVDFSDPFSRDDFIPREIRLPKGRPVKLVIRGLDVIHSVYMPHFKVQMYAIPGMETTFWFTPTKTTDEMRAETDDSGFNYELACNKICGNGHFSMRFLIVVEEAAAYDSWYSAQVPWLEKNPDYIVSYAVK